MEDFEKIRSLNPSNLICCDCSQKSPSNINITVGAFVCLKCATLLQRLQHKIKSTWDVFTEPELAQCRSINNSQINARYLAKYDRRYQAAPPNPHTDETTMIMFLKEKYVKRSWENTVFINQTPPSMRRTKSHHHKSHSESRNPESRNSESRISENRMNQNTRNSQRQLFSGNNETTTPAVHQVSSSNANFADFSVFNDSVLSRTRSDSTGHNNSGSSLESRNNSSGENKSFDDLECIANAMPQPQSKYESIAQLDMEEKIKRTQSSPPIPVESEKTPSGNSKFRHSNSQPQQKFSNPNYNQATYNAHQNFANHQQLLKQRTKSLDASSVTEVFLKTQFGSPTSTGHALFGVLPQNSPIRAQLQHALRLQHANNQHLTTFQTSSQTHNPGNPFITSSTQGSASIPQSRSLTPTSNTRFSIAAPSTQYHTPTRTTRSLAISTNPTNPFN